MNSSQAPNLIPPAGQEPGGPATDEIGPAALQAIPNARNTAGMPTPYLAIDVEVMARNLQRMHSFFRGRKSRLRPHVKTHKCSTIARTQIASGATGLTCSTTDEVAAMSSAGIRDLLLANVVTDRVRLQRLANVARDAEVTVAVDSTESAGLLSEAAKRSGASIGVVIDCDIGMGRNGVSAVDEALHLANVAEELPALSVRGVMAYEGHLVGIADREERARAAVGAFALAREVFDQLRSAGFAVSIFTGGATATYDSSGIDPHMTDVQAGTYPLMDNTYAGLTPEFEPAAAVITTVLTVRSLGRLVLNVGSKRISTDVGIPRLVGYPAIFGYVAEEHTVFTLTSRSCPAVGELVAVVPGHICTTMAMHRRVPGYRDGVLETIFEIDARDPLA